MITRLGTKVGTTDEMRLRSGHRVGVSGPAAKMPTSAAEARARSCGTVRAPARPLLGTERGSAPPTRAQSATRVRKSAALATASKSRYRPDAVASPPPPTRSSLTASRLENLTRKNALGRS